MSTPARANLAKVLGINLQKPEPTQAELNNGDHVYPIQTLEQYLEKEPRTTEFLLEYVPTGGSILRYFWSLFPFLHWIDRYNMQWLIGDLVAGESNPGYSKLARLLICDICGVNRYYDWCCGRSARHGLCHSCQSPTAIRPLLVLHGCLDLLVLRNFQGYHHRREFCSAPIYWCLFED
jgi:hypothetical protein